MLPEAATGIAATAVFCFITAWNEYAFALMMTNRNAQTAPPFIPSQLGSGLTDWTTIAAGTRPVPAAGRDLHLPAAQPPAARRDLRRDPQVTAWRSMSMRDEYRQFIGRYVVPSAMLLMILGIVFLCQPWS